MGLIKELENGDLKERQKITKRHLMVFVLSMLLSIAGASLLGWWFHKHHPANRHLWVVPIGLIFLFTPLVVWFSLFISDLSIKIEEEHGFEMNNQRVHPVDESLCEPKRGSLAYKTGFGFQFGGP